MVTGQETVFLHAWSGDEQKGCAFVAQRYPTCSVRLLSHRELRHAGLRGQLRSLHTLKGRALVFFFESLDDVAGPQLLVWSGLVHRCRDTVLADSCGRFEVYRRADWVWLLPGILLSAVGDVFAFVSSWLLLCLLRLFIRPQPLACAAEDRELDVAYLYPYPLDRSKVGGAMTHVRGFLGGLAAQGARGEIFTGKDLLVNSYPAFKILPKSHFYLFRESLMLRFNLTFASQVRRHLSQRPARVLYQRHGRFIIAGALLSRWMRIPLVLEYNGSELWLAEHWDPSRFCPWLRLCEEVSLSAAALFVVVSEELRRELLHLGVPESRILVNPNGVDPERFKPGSGGAELRHRLGLRPEHVVACFVGTFSYWHGVAVLQEAMLQLLGEREQNPEVSNLRFLLVGTGPLRAEMRQAFEVYEKAGLVFFAGSVSHDQVPAYLDASDVLLSPHVPMPDGRPFFGSPTKLFEYMAMAKAIIASDLDQLNRVLRHQETAWLVTPGNATELAAAIRLLAADPALRRRLGQNARAAALARYSWKQNAARVLSCLPRPIAVQHSREALPFSAATVRGASTGIQNPAED